MKQRSRDAWIPRPQHFVPFGLYGGGQTTAHPIGLVLGIGFLLMGPLLRTPASLLVLASLLSGPMVGFFLGPATAHVTPGRSLTASPALIFIRLCKTVP